MGDFNEDREELLYAAQHKMPEVNDDAWDAWDALIERQERDKTPRGRAWNHIMDAAGSEPGSRERADHIDKALAIVSTFEKRDQLSHLNRANCYVPAGTNQDKRLQAMREEAKAAEQARSR